MEKAPKRVWTRKGTGLMLAKRFGVTPDWVSKSLTGQANTDTSRKIRAIAVKEYGGIPIYE